MLALPATAIAQSPRPYAGLEARPIKALSASQIEDLRAGRGMGLALAAELNGYPGPIHVLELGSDLSLSPEQRARVTALRADMVAEAVPLGEQLIAHEAALDRLFAERQVTVETLAQTTQLIGMTQGKLRAAHLKFHLATLDVLTPEQARHYAMLRGYGGQDQAPAHSRRH
jgi:Spy/CpxP family protein refolding chaperone